MFLTSTEISELTGYKYKKLQIKWLVERGYKFEVSVAGEAKVLRAHIEERLGGQSYRLKKDEPLNFSNSKYFG